MKRFLMLITAMTLFLTAACTATADGVTFKTAYFTMQMPEGWEIDTDDLEKKEGEETLGFFGVELPEGMLIGGAYLVYYEQLKDIALWNSSEEELKEYTEALLDEFADNNPELIGTVMAGRIPLVLIKGADADGEFLYADTMTNGYAVEFEFFVTDAEGEKQLPLTERHIEQVKTLLATFQPAA
ncbi:MAG: hypothetical protein IKE81_12035 [Clostridia bacterium]|jgi:hypothetical protein|nr:hypothetical protein [Clostridia bacterium]